MAFNKQSIAFALVVSLVLFFGGCYGAIYTVGDDFEWLVMSNDTYSDWSASKMFHVGDIIFFRYSYLDHNVMQVKHDHYQSCNSTSPLAIYENGHDFITLETLGHLYFICGFPKHCEFGQRVDINVVPTLSPTSSPSPTQSTLSPPIESPPPNPTKKYDDPSSTTPTSSPAPSPTEKSVVSTSPIISPYPGQSQATDSEIPDTQSPPKKSAAAVTMSTLHYSMGSLVLASVIAYLF